MAFETKPNTGALFKNDKQGNDKRPDYTGTCLVDGKEYRISAWLNTSKSGVRYMSLNFQIDKPIVPASDINVDDDIPF